MIEVKPSEPFPEAEPELWPANDELPWYAVAPVNWPEDYRRKQQWTLPAPEPLSE